jgi:hypothetical protein
MKPSTLSLIVKVIFDLAFVQEYLDEDFKFGKSVNICISEAVSWESVSIEMFL